MRTSRKKSFYASKNNMFDCLSKCSCDIRLQNKKAFSNDVKVTIVGFHMTALLIPIFYFHDVKAQLKTN